MAAGTVEDSGPQQDGTQQDWTALGQQDWTAERPGAYRPEGHLEAGLQLLDLSWPLGGAGPGQGLRVSCRASPSPGA